MPKNSVLIQRAARSFVGWRSPGGAATTDFLVAHGHVDGAIFGVNRDLVASLHQGNRTAFPRLRGDVPNDEAVTAAGWGVMRSDKPMATVTLIVLNGAA